MMIPTQIPKYLKNTRDKIANTRKAYCQPACLSENPFTFRLNMGKLMISKIGKTMLVAITMGVLTEKSW